MSTFRKFNNCQSNQKMNVAESRKRNSSFSYLSGKGGRGSSVKKAVMINKMQRPNPREEKMKCVYQMSSSLAKKDKQIEELENEVEKLTNEINRMQLQKMVYNQKILNINTQTSIGFDTGSNFPSVSKIALTWNDFAKNDIVNTFVDFEDFPDIVYTDFILHLTQEMFILVQKLIKEKEDEYYKKIADILSLPYDNNNIYIQIKDSLNILLKENLDNVFGLSTFYEQFRQEYFSFYVNHINKRNEDFQKMMDTNEFKNMVNNVKNILLFFEFNPQKVSLDLDSYEERKFEIFNVKNNQNKRSYFLIFNDRVENNENILIILKPPLIKGKYLLNKDFKIIAMAFSQGQIDPNKQVTEFNDFHELENPEDKRVKLSSLNLNQSLEQNSNENSKEHCNTDIYEDKKECINFDYINIENNHRFYDHLASPTNINSENTPLKLNTESPKGLSPIFKQSSNLNEDFLHNEYLKQVQKKMDFSDAKNKKKNKNIGASGTLIEEKKTNKKYKIIEQAKKKSTEKLKSELSYRNTNKMMQTKKYINHYGRKNMNKIINEHSNQSLNSNNETSPRSSSLKNGPNTCFKKKGTTFTSCGMSQNKPTDFQQPFNIRESNNNSRTIIINNNELQNMSKDKIIIQIKMSKNKDDKSEQKRTNGNNKGYNYIDKENNLFVPTEDTCCSLSNQQELNNNSSNLTNIISNNMNNNNNSLNLNYTNNVSSSTPNICNNLYYDKVNSNVHNSINSIKIENHFKQVPIYHHHLQNKK